MPSHTVHMDNLFLKTSMIWNDRVGKEKTDYER